MRRFPIVILLASALCAPLAASASIMFVAHLSVDQEPTIAGPTTDTGAPRPVPFGEGTFVLNDLQDQLTMDVSVFDIDVTGTQTTDTNDNLRAAHIHELPDLSTPTGPVRWGFFGAPFNESLAWSRCVGSAMLRRLYLQTIPTARRKLTSIDPIDRPGGRTFASRFRPAPVFPGLLPRRGASRAGICCNLP